MWSFMFIVATLALSVSAQNKIRKFSFQFIYRKKKPIA